MSRTQVASVVSRQLPEFIREDYPTFVSFVEAYYDFLQTQQVDLTDIKDLDKTLEDYIVYFKKEIAHNLPQNLVEDERFLLQYIKDQYLSKGSESSYKLLFRILFGKNVELTYPGKQMLVASDGRWNQELSLFAQIDYGAADSIVGKLVDIQTPNKVLRVLIDRKEELTGEVDRVVKIGSAFQISSTGTTGDDYVTVVSSANIIIGQLVTGTGIPASTRVVSIEDNVVYLSNFITSDISNNLTFSNEVYEFFLDKKFFGVVSPGDKIRYRDEFQATILPTTSKLTISQPGQNFRAGQVFQVQSGNGTDALIKITKVDSDGGVKYAEFIKFGIGYTSDFAISILASNSVSSGQSIAAGNIAASSSGLTKANTYSSSATGTLSVNTSAISAGSFTVGKKYQITSVGTTDWVAIGAASNTLGVKFVATGIGSGTGTAVSLTVTGTGTSFGATGNVVAGDELWTTDTVPLFIGVVESVSSTTSLTVESLYSEYQSGIVISGTYSGSYTFRNTRSVGSLYTFDDGIDENTQAVYELLGINDRTLGFNEQGYINSVDYVTEDYVDGTYAGTAITEFSLSYRNAQTTAEEAAVISVDLDALAKYPGYYTTNNGFVSDAIYIQDSRYYQKFSYVIRLDERLSRYKSAVKTMLHPAGMALFGEFNITNSYDLSIALESLVKSLGIGVEDEIIVDSAAPYFTFTKSAEDYIDTPSDSFIQTFSKALTDDIDTPEDALVQLFSKSITSSNGFTDEYVTLEDDGSVREVGKALSTSYSGMLDTTYTFDVSKSLADSATPSDSAVLTTTKYIEDTEIGTFVEYGEIWLNPYQGQYYFSEDYSEGLAETFT